MRLGLFGSLCLALSGLASCVEVDKKLGQNYLASNQQYNIYTAEFTIDDIRMERPEELTSLSNYRFTFGAVRDPLFGLSTRATAFTLVPINDTLDFGKAGTQKFRQFHFAAPLDTLSYTRDRDKHILQNVNVYELSKSFDTNDSNPEIVFDKK